MKPLASAAALLVGIGWCIQPAVACLNTYKSDIAELLRTGNRSGANRLVAHLEAAQKAGPTLENTNDLAVARILFGRYDEAIVLLNGLEQRYPGKAITAANLGTALELSGRNDEALRWIRAGVERDPREHQGSEWLHVKILEAKLALDSDPAWLDKHSVLELDFGIAPEPRLPVVMPLDAQSTPRKAAAVSMAIAYQLKERTKFVKPPDAVVADLYETMANLVYAIRRFDGSLVMNTLPPRMDYQSALEYGTRNVRRVTARAAQVQKDYPNLSW